MTIYPQVAGQFYPKEPELLRLNVLAMLNAANAHAKLPQPKAIIAPHAGYIYSGPIAASAYACLAFAKKKIKRVVLLAPAHKYQVTGIATTNAEFYLTPLGQIEIDHQSIAKLKSPFLNINEEAFNQEHALEVQLPFLQLTLENFLLIPLLIGSASLVQVATIIEKLWGNQETLVVISSDLSHYHPYKEAMRLDRKTAGTITELNFNGFSYEEACGSTAIKGLLIIAAKKHLQAQAIDLRNSGDTAGAKDSVVGYGAFHFN